MLSIFLPIKSTSKRIKNKNFLKINNHDLGLTDIKINQLLKLKKLLRKKIDIEIVISTDEKRIINKYGNSILLKIFKRKKFLTRDDCLDDLIREVPKLCNFKFILWTHVTSPMFTSSEYINFIISFFKQKKFKSAFSATLISTFFMNNNYNWISHDYKKKKWPRTQDLKNFYLVNNAAFIATRKNYITYNDRLDNKPMPIVSKKYSDIDIDEKIDLDFYKNFFQKKKFII
jgi:N-acylneuraminate cytidylyltransferase